MELLQAWAEELPDLPRHKSSEWHSTRQAHLQARWRSKAAEHGWQTQADGITYFRRLFRHIGKSDFLCGRARPKTPDSPPFMCSLEWLVRPTNWSKVIEGNYHRGTAA